MNDRLIRQRGFFFGMVLVLAMLALILAWLFIQSILLALALVVILSVIGGLRVMGIIGAMFFTVLKNVTKPFRRGTAESVGANQAGTDGTETTP